MSPSLPPVVVFVDSAEVRCEAHERGVALEGVRIAESAQVSAVAFTQALHAALLAQGWVPKECDSLARRICACSPSLWKNPQRRWQRVQRTILGHVGRRALTLVARAPDVQALVPRSRSASAS